MARSYADVLREIGPNDTIGKLMLRIVRAYKQNKGVRLSAEELQEFSCSDVGDWIDNYVIDVLEEDDDPQDD